jgi:glutamate--cysteine ligase
MEGAMTDVEVFAQECFTVTQEDRLGVELEFLVFDSETPVSPVPIQRISEVLPPMPGGSRVTFEPGGQLELSAPPRPLPTAIADLIADVEAVRLALGEAGLMLGESGLDSGRPPERQRREPRYEAMAAFLGRPYGVTMMCSTASIQLNLDFGADPATRWNRAHLLGPVLVAAFANSPVRGWMSGRQAVWHNLDRSRTAPVAAGGHHAEEWAEYLLASRLMLIRESGDGCRPVLDGSLFRDFARAAGRPPTREDVAYHATTLFPPVRPRGWMEVRYLDAQGPDAWPVCAAVAYAVITDDRTADAALAAAEPVKGMWLEAARLGLGDARLRRAAEACFRAALEALPQLGGTPWLVDQVAAFAARHVEPGRSPAADLLEELRV